MIKAKCYTPDGLLASLSDANDNATALAYDGFDRVATTTYPDSSSETQGYDANGNMLGRKTRNNISIAYSYDSLNRLASKTPPSFPPSSPAVSYSYDLGLTITGCGCTRRGWGGSCRVIPQGADAIMWHAKQVKR